MGQTEITFIRPQEVYDRNTGESKVRYRSYDGNDRFIPVVDGEKGVPKTMVEVTHAELKAMRDGGKLTAGALYRITDYVTTTSQENTRSAGHQFDIVLLALSENKLAEEGWAMMHENDTYFANSNLSAWKIWYCLDNDKSRFAWADGGTPAIKDYEYYGVNVPFIRDANADELGKYAWYNEDEAAHLFTDSDNPKIGDLTYEIIGDEIDAVGHVNEVLGFGKGVIYRLIDEFNNDIKYDFKNIQFKRKITDGQYDANGTETWCYTLNVWYEDLCQDASIVGNTLQNDEGYVTGVYDNIFGYATAYDLHLEGVSTFAFALGNNVVLSFDEGEYYGIYSNMVGNGFHSNTIGNKFFNNTILNNFYSNRIGNHFYSNTIGNEFYSNTVGNDVFFNMIGNDFSSKTISNNTSSKNYGNNGVELATKS